MMGWTVLAVLLSYYSVKLRIQADCWRDNGRLWGHAYRINKYGILPAREYSKTVAREGKHTEAMVMMEEAMVLDPIDPGVRYSMATSLLVKGRRKESRKMAIEGLRQLEQYYYDERDKFLKGLEEERAAKRIPMQGPYPHKLQKVFHTLNSVKGSMGILIVALGQSSCTVAHMGRLALEALKISPTNKEVRANAENMDSIVSQLFKAKMDPSSVFVTLVPTKGEHEEVHERQFAIPSAEKQGLQSLHKPGVLDNDLLNPKCEEVDVNMGRESRRGIGEEEDEQAVGLDPVKTENLESAV